METKLEKGLSGAFEVTFRDQLIFSKKALGRFPKDGEVATEIANRLA